MIIRKLLSGNKSINYQKLTMASPGKFLYFAYGSNLSTERIHLNNPSAVETNRHIKFNGITIWKSSE